MFLHVLRRIHQAGDQHTAFIAETGSQPPCCCWARSKSGITADCL